MHCFGPHPNDEKSEIVQFYRKIFDCWKTHFVWLRSITNRLFDRKNSLQVSSFSSKKVIRPSNFNLKLSYFKFGEYGAYIKMNLLYVMCATIQKWFNHESSQKKRKKQRVLASLFVSGQDTLLTFFLSESRGGRISFRLWIHVTFDQAGLHVYGP